MFILISFVEYKEVTKLKYALVWRNEIAVIFLLKFIFLTKTYSIFYCKENGAYEIYIYIIMHLEECSTVAATPFEDTPFRRCRPIRIEGALVTLKKLSK